MRRLKKRAEFLRIAAARQSAGRPGLVLQAARHSPDAGSGPASLHEEAGIGFTASRKVGGAVERNRAKRRLRALAREVMPENVVQDRDYVLIARSETPRRPYRLLRRDLISALKRLKAWTGANGADEA